MKRRFIFIDCMLMLVFIISLPVQAKLQLSKNRLALYEKPSVSAKVIAHIRHFERVTPFFYKGKWIKVGVNKTGVVGWVHAEDYAKYAHPIFHFQKSEKTPHTMSVFQYSGSEPINQAEVKKMMQQMQQRQVAIQRDMLKLERDLMRNPYGFGAMMEPLFVLPGEEVRITALSERHPSHQHKNIT